MIARLIIATLPLLVACTSSPAAKAPASEGAESRPGVWKQELWWQLREWREIDGARYALVLYRADPVWPNLDWNDWQGPRPPKEWLDDGCSECRAPSVFPKSEGGAAAAGVVSFEEEEDSEEDEDFEEDEDLEEESFEVDDSQVRSSTEIAAAAKPTIASIREELGDYPLPAKYEEEGEGSVLVLHTPAMHQRLRRVVRSRLCPHGAK